MIVYYSQAEKAELAIFIKKYATITFYFDIVNVFLSPLIFLKRAEKLLDTFRMISNVSNTKPGWVAEHLDDKKVICLFHKSREKVLIRQTV